VPEVTRRGSPLSVTRDIAARPVHDRTRRTDALARMGARVSARRRVVVVGVIDRGLG
jgi:hypothetical protein